MGNPVKHLLPLTQLLNLHGRFSEIRRSIHQINRALQYEYPLHLDIHQQGDQAGVSWITPETVLSQRQAAA